MKFRNIFFALFILLNGITNFSIQKSLACEIKEAKIDNKIGNLRKSYSGEVHAFESPEIYVAYLDPNNSYSRNSIKFLNMENPDDKGEFERLKLLTSIISSWEDEGFTLLENSSFGYPLADVLLVHASLQPTKKHMFFFEIRKKSEHASNTMQVLQQLPSKEVLCYLKEKLNIEADNLVDFKRVISEHANTSEVEYKKRKDDITKKYAEILREQVDYFKQRYKELTEEKKIYQSAVTALEKQHEDLAQRLKGVESKKSQEAENFCDNIQQLIIEEKELNEDYLMRLINQQEDTTADLLLKMTQLEQETASLYETLNELADQHEDEKKDLLNKIQTLATQKDSLTEAVEHLTADQAHMQRDLREKIQEVENDKNNLLTHMQERAREQDQELEKLRQKITQLEQDKQRISEEKKTQSYRVKVSALPVQECTMSPKTAHLIRKIAGVREVTPINN